LALIYLEITCGKWDQILFRHDESGSFLAGESHIATAVKDHCKRMFNPGGMVGNGGEHAVLLFPAEFSAGTGILPNAGQLFRSQDDLTCFVQMCKVILQQFERPLLGILNVSRIFQETNTK